MSRKLCKYGCGREGKTQLKSGEWICEDNYRSCPINRAKYSNPGKQNSMYGRKHSEQTKQLIGKKSKLKTFSEEQRKQMRCRMEGNAYAQGLVHTDKSKELMRQRQLGKKLTKEHKKKIGLAHQGKVLSNSLKRRLSKIAKKRFQDPIFLEKYRKSMRRRPTYPEKVVRQILTELNINFEYVGDFSKWINNCNPDFINENTKQIIELFGEYWHSRKITGKPRQVHEQERIDIFKKVGYKTLVIWEHELANIEKVKEKIESFATDYLQKEQLDGSQRNIHQEG